MVNAAAELWMPHDDVVHTWRLLTSNGFNGQKKSILFEIRRQCISLVVLQSV